MSLRILESPRPADVPDTPEGFLRALGGPAIVRIEGRDRSRVRAASTLLHGNEPSGLRALHGRLRSGRTPSVSVLCFVGAVGAALAPPGFAHRALPGGADLNRCFRPPFAGDEGAVAADALHQLRAARPEALVDLHNNTGHNPPYGVVPSLERGVLRLVSLFADRCVHSDLRLGALVEATIRDFPSATIECGRAGDPAADAVARAGLDRLLDLETLDLDGPDPPLRVLADPVRVRLRPGLRIAFDDRPRDGADLTVAADADRHNFRNLEPGFTLGWLGPGAGWPLEAAGAEGRDVSADFFAVRDGRLVMRRAAIPIMMTTDPIVAASDCLFYLVREAAGGREDRGRGWGKAGGESA